MASVYSFLTEHILEHDEEILFFFLKAHHIVLSFFLPFATKHRKVRFQPDDGPICTTAPDLLGPLKVQAAFVKRKA